MVEAEEDTLKREKQGKRTENVRSPKRRIVGSKDRGQRRLVLTVLWRKATPFHQPNSNLNVHRTPIISEFQHG